MDIQLIDIPLIEIYWTEWYAWNRLMLDRRDPNSITPPNVSGVYEVKLNHEEERLTIGKASDLRKRVKKGLVKGQIPHSSGKKIRVHEDTTQIVMRWAETDRPAAVEEELHQHHKEIFGRLPKYTIRT